MPVALISDSSTGSSPQLSLEATSAPLPSRSSSVGSRQRSRHRQRWADRAHDHPQRILPQHNQSADQDVVPRLHQAARGNVRQLRIDRLIQIVRFHHSDAGPVVHPAHDGRVSGVVRRQGRHDGRFQIVAWRNCRRDDLRFLTSMRQLSLERIRPPEESRSSRIGSASAPAKRQRRPDGAHDNPLRLRAGDNESADQNVVARFHAQTRRDVRQSGNLISHGQLRRITGIFAAVESLGRSRVDFIAANDPPKLVAGLETHDCTSAINPLPLQV